MATNVRVLVLGAGPTGIVTAWGLKENGVTDVCIVEKADRPGGLARSRQVAGRRVDFGPHVVHTRDERGRRVIEHLLGSELRPMRDERVGVWLRGRPIDYPPSLGQLSSALGARETVRCGASFLRSHLFRRRGDGARTCESRLIARYGRRFYQVALAPMARKMWGVEPPALSEDLDDERVMWSGRGFRRVRQTSYYPQGCSGDIWDNGVAQLRASGVSVMVNARPVSVRIEGDRIASVTVRTDERDLELRPEYVVSTIPLHDLLSVLEPRASGMTRRALERILYRALVIVYVVFRSPKMSPFHYSYFPEPDYAFHRLFEQKNFTDRAENGEHTVIGAELSCFTDDEIWNAPDEELLEKVVSGLERAQLAAGNDIAASTTARESHAYPMYTWNYRGALETILDELGRIENLLLNGRHGLFKLNNVHHCVEMGLAAADHIARERPRESWQASIRGFKRFRVSDY